MLNKTFIFITILLTLTMHSCKDHLKDQVGKKADKIISINPNDASDEINLSEFVDSIEYIKLQTDPSCLIGYAAQVIIRDEYIYVADIYNRAAFVFDKKGNFVSIFDKIGRGPDEFIEFRPIIVDDQEEHISIVTTTSKGYRYLTYTNIAFELIDDQPMPAIYADWQRREGNTHYFATQQGNVRVNDKLSNPAMVIVKDGEIVRILFDKTLDDHRNYMAWWPNYEWFTRNDEGELFVSFMYDNSFYQLEGINANPVFTIDFGKYGIDNKTIGSKTRREQLNYMNNMSGLAAFPVLTINNSNIMSFSYYFKSSADADFFDFENGVDFHQYIELKNSQRIFHTKKIKNDITGFPEYVYVSSFYYNIMWHDAWYKDYLVNVFVPELHISGSKTTKYVKGLGEVAKDDNPIIVLMRLKSDER